MFRNSLTTDLQKHKIYIKPLKTQKCQTLVVQYWWKTCIEIKCSMGMMPLGFSPHWFWIWATVSCKTNFLPSKNHRKPQKYVVVQYWWKPCPHNYCSMGWEMTGKHQNWLPWGVHYYSNQEGELCETPILLGIEILCLFPVTIPSLGFHVCWTYTP